MHLCIFIVSKRYHKMSNNPQLFILLRQTGDGDMENSIVLQPNQTIENRGDKSYLIVWQV